MNAGKKPVTLIEWRSGASNVLIDRDYISPSRLDNGEITVGEFVSDKLDNEWSEFAEGDTIAVLSGWVETEED